ncbi:MAG: QueT transporter family protein [Oscillospiraceae bacterium]|nr:QueT transporter family protein [Oscillospiraceae bacterium]
MNKAKIITRQAMIAAIYTVTSTLLAPLSFSSIQVRVSEALTLLPVFGPENIIGITVGCFLTNLIGVMTGADLLGAFDIVFGTMATLFAGIATYMLRNVRTKDVPVAAALPPIILNAVVVGMELCVLISGGFNPVVFAGQALSVGIGEALSCILGLILVRLIEKNPSLSKVFD